MPNKSIYQIAILLICFCIPAHAELSETTQKDKYVKYGPVFDDDLIRVAVQRVRTKGSNSQHWADDVRLEYYRLRERGKLCK